MASKPETTFIASVNRLLPLKRLKMCASVRTDTHKTKWIGYEKMNNPYSSGTADSWYSGKGGDLWIEYKFLPRIPQRGSVSPTKLLSALQLQWLTERYEEGRNVAVIIGCPTGGVLLRDRTWECELTASQFTSLIRPRSDLASWIKEQTTR